MIRIILAGQLRGNEHTWNSLVNAFRTFTVPISLYVGGERRWDRFTLPHKWVTTTIDNQSIFWHSRHVHRMRYLAQWSALYQTYHAFAHEFAETDIIVKARNDLNITDTCTVDVQENVIYVPEKEFHETVPFDTEIICNDQIVIGRKHVMDRYFKLSRHYDWASCYDLSIERILRNYLRQQNMQLKTFPFHYSKNIG
jgi:hypothetical protein